LEWSINATTESALGVPRLADLCCTGLHVHKTKREAIAAGSLTKKSLYLTLGLYDWLIIAEAPDEPTMVSAVLAAAAGGSLSE
jgi:uncharacterized protein with GYD domain